MRKSLYLLVFLFPFTFHLFSQSLAEDYDRAFQIEKQFSGKTLHAVSDGKWFKTDNSSLYIYKTQTASGYEYYRVQPDKKEKKRLFDTSRLATLLTKELKEEIDPRTLNISVVEVSGSPFLLKIAYAGKYWFYSPQKHTLRYDSDIPAKKSSGLDWSEDDEQGVTPVLSPDGCYLAYIRDYNVYIKGVKDQQVSVLSFDGSNGDYYSSNLIWSPDSKKIAVCKIRPAEKQYYYVVESSPADQLQPRLHKREYRKPGSALPYKHPHIFNIENGAMLRPETTLFQTPYFIEGLCWSEDSQNLLFDYNQRGHQLYRVVRVDAFTGKTYTVVEERSETFINYHNRYFRQLIDQDRKIIWMSERDDRIHLYMYDVASGRVINQITKGDWDVRYVVHTDEKSSRIIFAASGMNEGEDPYNIHFYSVNLDGTGLTCLTPEKGMHSASFSDDFTYLTDTYSQVNVPPVSVMRSAKDGQIITELETADISLLKQAGWQAPEPFIAKGRDGVTDIWGIIIRPSNFDASRSYPVLEYIYAGPGNQWVPKTFNATYSTMTGIAELGFIVVQIDGMGTSYRGKQFENVIWKNLNDIGLPDRMLWTKAAAQKYPYMDINRVGIYGCSAGGQNAMSALLQFPDFYKAAYAACGCHDNRMDKIWWNEQWLGYPVGEQYAACSNVENAHKLKRPLMLMVGEMDDNVDPASTMQVVNALVKAGKDFDYIVVPGGGHTLGRGWAERKRYDFFVRHLMQTTPPLWESMK